MMARIHTLLAIVYSLSGCVAYTPRDLSFVSITVVDFKEQAELPFKEGGRICAPHRDSIFNIMDEKQEEEIVADDIRPYFLSDQAIQLQQQKK